MSDRCGDYLVVEHNGDVYPCDFYVDPASRLGNIGDLTWEQLRQSPRQREFLARKRQLPGACLACPHLDLCHGDCPRLRPATTAPADALPPAWLCEGWRRFHTRTAAEFDLLAEQVRARRRPAG